ncbi:MAG: FtsX-like permease family protein [bacterium]|nr:FtsX-like permease family protein [bacterium]
MDRQNKPPVFAEWLLKKVLPGDNWNTSSGDFEEYYSNLVKEKNQPAALLWYWKNILFLTPKKLYQSIWRSNAMFKNYLKIAIRNILRYKGYSFINIAGLAIGMTCSILIFLWIMDEMSFDKFHEKDDVIYSIPAWQYYSGEGRPWSGTPPALGPAVKDEYPEIVNTARLEPNYGATLTVTYGEKIFKEVIINADISLLEIFSFPLVKGSIEAGLSDPYSIYMTEEMAEKYFADEDPVGKVLTIENTYNFTVMGVLENIPDNSTIRFDFLVPLEFTQKLYNNPNYTSTWGNLYCRTYAQIMPGTSIDDFNSKIEKLIIDRNGGRDRVLPFLSKYSEIYLYGNIGEGRNILNVKVFSVIAFAVLFLACINFVNLSTARSTKRAKEVGLRKVAGANRKNLIRQFLGEAVSLSLIAVIIALILTALLLPVFNDISGKNLDLNDIRNGKTLLAIIAIVFTAGILAGSYPAFFLSSFRPVNVFKGITGSGRASVYFRNVLVISQFAISIGLIICTMIVRSQLDHVGGMDLGLNKEQIIFVPINDTIRQQYEAVKQELLKNPGIEKITATQTLITQVGWNWHNWDWEGRDPSEDPLVTNLFADDDFLTTFDIELKSGRFLQNEINENSYWSNNIVINETFMNIMNMDSPVGKQISNGNNSYNIVGVVKDFHFKSAFVQIEPIVIAYNPRVYNVMFLKINSAQTEEIISNVESVMKTFDPGSPFEYTFLDESYERLYGAQQQFGTIFQYFALLAIIISCLGLFGLALFITEQKIKEIGIRKTLGAPVSGIIMLLSKEFVKWVLMANIIAWPLAWFFMTGWLESFVYRAEIGLTIFVTAGIIGVLIALVTVFYQVMRAVSANPVDSLRYE